MSEIYFNTLSEAEKYEVTFYFVNQLFSYCLAMENPTCNDALKDQDILKNPDLYFKKTKDLCLILGLNKAKKLKELTADSADILDDISWDLEKKHSSICKHANRFMPNVYEKFPYSIFLIKYNLKGTLF